MHTRARKPSVKLVHGQAITTSLKVAEAFGKRHDSVLRTIAALECSPEFRAHNFVAAEYTDAQGKPRPMFTITRDGFAFLASGFTGKEAAQWKEKYIAAFNELERRALDKAAARRLPTPAAPLALPKGSYHYPRTMLDQPYFVSPVTGKASLNLAMLADATQYVSPLMALLNQLRSEGHHIEAAFDEAVAMRSVIQQADKTIEEISTLAMKARFRGSKNGFQ